MRTTETNTTSSYERAKNKVAKLKDFYTHLAIYLLFIPFFIFLNFRSGSFPWAIFPIFGWGLGVLGHASETFSWNAFFGRGWEERKIREYMDQEQQDQMRF